MWAVHHVVAMQRVAAAHLDPLRLAPEDDLDLVEHPVEPAVGLDVAPPALRQRADGVDGDDPHPLAARRQPPREVELADVAAEEVLEVDRGDEQVDPPRRAVAHRQPQRRDLLGDRAHGRLGGRAGAGPRVEGGRRQRVEAREAGRRVARARRQQPPPREAVGEHPLGAERVAAPAQQLLRAAPGQPRQRGERAVGALEALERPALARRHPRPQPQPQDRRELQQPADVDVVVHAPQPDPLARVAAHRLQPLAHPRHAVGGGVPERRAAVLDVVVQAAARRTRCRRARAPRARASGRGSARTARVGTAARRAAARPGRARRRR